MLVETEEYNLSRSPLWCLAWMKNEWKLSSWSLMLHCLCTNNFHIYSSSLNKGPQSSAIQRRWSALGQQKNPTSQHPNHVVPSISKKSLFSKLQWYGYTIMEDQVLGIYLTEADLVKGGKERRARANRTWMKTKTIKLCVDVSMTGEFTTKPVFRVGLGSSLSNFSVQVNSISDVFCTWISTCMETCNAMLLTSVAQIHMTKHKHRSTSSPWHYAWLGNPFPNMLIKSK